MTDNMDFSVNFSSWGDSTLINYYYHSPLASGRQAALAELEKRGKLHRVNAAAVDKQLDDCERKDHKLAQINALTPLSHFCILAVLFFLSFLTGCAGECRMPSAECRVETAPQTRAEVVPEPVSGELLPAPRDARECRNGHCGN